MLLVKYCVTLSAALDPCPSVIGTFCYSTIFINCTFDCSKTSQSFQVLSDVLLFVTIFLFVLKDLFHISIRMATKASAHFYHLGKNFKKKSPHLSGILKILCQKWSMRPWMSSSLISISWYLIHSSPTLNFFIPCDTRHCRCNCLAIFLWLWWVLFPWIKAC